MPDELEERLARTLQALPPAAGDSTQRALRAALQALPPAAEARRRRRRRLVVPAVACVVAFVFGGVTLAATGGRLPLVGTPLHHHHARTHAPAPHGVVLPRGAIAFAVQAGGRAWLKSSSGTALRASPTTAFALSPGAVWAVAGSHNRIDAVGVQQHGTGFSRAVGGTPVAAAWAPAGIRIAYVVHSARGDRLFDMYGNGTHSFLVSGHVAPVTPSWRWDSQAFAYISASGRVAVHNAISGSTTVVARACGLRHAAAVAFAPFGGLLAIADAEGRVEVVDTLHGGSPHCERGQPGAPSIAWLRPRQLIVGSGEAIVRYDVYGRFAGADLTSVPGAVAGLAAGDDGRRLALALRDPEGGVRVIEARTPRFSSARYPLRVYRRLLTLPDASGVVALSWQ